jgi:hypothetical protein
VTLRNVTLSGNRAGQGGGLYQSNGATVLINSSVITNTSDGSGGGLFRNIGSVSVANTLLAFNAPDNCDEPVGGGDGSLQFPDTTCGDMLMTADPLVGPLADNGGNTLTHALLPGSPAIQGAQTGICPATDQRGFARPAGGLCDIGAFSWLQFALPLLVK